MPPACAIISTIGPEEQSQLNCRQQQLIRPDCRNPAGQAFFRHKFVSARQNQVFAVQSVDFFEMFKNCLTYKNLVGKIKPINAREQKGG